MVQCPCISDVSLSDLLIKRFFVINRYIYKFEAQRTISDLRGKNFQLQQSNQNLQKRLTSFKKEVSTIEDETKKKEEENNDIMQVIDHLTAETESEL